MIQKLGNTKSGSLKNETGNNYYKVITKSDRSLLQSVPGITKCDSYYKVRRNREFLLQKKALRTITFQPTDSHSSPLFKKQSLLKFEDKIQLETVLLVSIYFGNILPSIFEKWFTLC